MKLSRSVQMTQTLIQDTLTLATKGPHEAVESGFRADIFPWAINAQIQKNLEHIQMLLEGIAEDARVLEKRMSDAKQPDEYGVDAESGKPFGRYLGVAKA